MENKLNMHYFVKIYAPELILKIMKMNPDFAQKQPLNQFLIVGK